ncbi:hypothetical protein SAMN05192558_102259 [Actinokineospora alba]|uniref:LPXTG-motif cell wall anchor domain-containing protein n=1 Tax=Actinokineospora alba TaxID=504798 RepID=A0A1H0HTY2_9PSEU|nr:hypothetical protein [Actinokineospora alba]TDP64748.1 hypothetical protein C8E96_0219 [Actinokineospora alba]SDH44908.1 hypothetical protein SAMN05421871_10144 [Actinokineospora alba]SDO22593.1 hypothetical protein SAMN05192558_102259 [Actinokineospora alba]
MRAVRVLLVGLGVGAATLFTVSPATAEQGQPAPPSTTVKAPQPSAAPSSAVVTSSPTPIPTTAPARPRPKGGVQTGGGSPEGDNTGLMLGGGAAIVAGFGAFALRRRAVRGSN